MSESSKEGGRPGEDRGVRIWQRGSVRDMGVILLLLLLCALFFWRVITPNQAARGSFRQGDFYDQFYAFAAFEYEQLSQGELPLWNPYTFSGHPFLADIQSAIFYPVSLLTMLASLLWGFSAFALELEAIAHFFLAGVFTYFFAKRLLGNRPAALIAAVTFVFGGYLTSFPPLQLAVLETVTWLPLILLLLDRGVYALWRAMPLRYRGDHGLCLSLGTGRVNSTRSRGWSPLQPGSPGLRGGASSDEGRLAILYLLLAGLALGIALLAGHPQTAMYVFYVSALYCLFKVWLVVKGRGSLTARGEVGGRGAALRYTVGGLIIFALAAVGLAAVQLVPSWEFMRLSSRPELGYQELSAGFAYLDFVQIVLPHATGFWSPLYVGILPLLLGLFALLVAVGVGVGGQEGSTAAVDKNSVEDVSRGRGLSGAREVDPVQPRRVRLGRVEIGFWAVLALLALLLSVGDENFLYSLFYLYLPGFGLFRGQERAALVFSFALSMLAGYGFRALLLWGQQAEQRQKGWRLFGGLILVLGLTIAALIALLFYGRSTMGGLMDAMLGLAVFVGLLLVGSLVWLAIWRWRRGGALVTTTLALAIILVDLFMVNSRPNVQGRRIENQFAATGVVATLLEQPGIFRVHNEFRLPGNYGVAFGVEDTWGASPLRLASYERLFETVPLERAWELLNVGYVVTWLEDLDVPAQPVYEEPAKRGEVDYVQRLETEHPRGWIVYQVEVLPDEDAVLSRLAQPDLNPYRVGLLTESEAASLPATLGSGGKAGSLGEDVPHAGQVNFAEVGPSRLVIEVDHGTEGLLILSEVFYPGWQARVDGERVPILLADAVLRAVRVPAGEHVVEMTFEPGSLKLGAAISGVTLLLSAGYVVWYAARRSKRSRDGQLAGE